MATKQQTEAIEHYANLMAEVKLRFTGIELATNGLTKLFNPLVNEFCFLQFRMICELVALGCLVVHGDIEAAQANRLQKEYSADRILAELEKLHPYFFPQPVTQDARERGHFTGLPAGFLTKAELTAIYGRCGDVLHRGRLKSLVPGNEWARRQYPEITEYRRRLDQLLNMHMFGLVGGQVVICMLYDANNRNNVQVAIAEPQTVEPTVKPPEGTT